MGLVKVTKVKIERSILTVAAQGVYRPRQTCLQYRCTLCKSASRSLTLNDFLGLFDGHECENRLYILDGTM